MPTEGHPSSGMGGMNKGLNIQLDLAWRIGPGETRSVPANLFALLQGISHHGSLSAGAKEIGISYRSAWNLIQEWTDFLGTPLILATRGRGAQLTPLGKKLVWGAEHARSSLKEARALTLADVQSEIDRVLESGTSDPVTIHASHCLSHEILREVYLDHTGTRLDLEHCGSVTSLEHLQAGECHVAGFHLVDGELSERFCKRYRQFIDPQDVYLVTALKRKQGLIVQKGNPLALNGIADLVKSKARLVNRQLNSGTRLLLDELIRSSGVNSADIVGYDNIEFTHTAVGALVAENSVDAGLGTEAAAFKFKLDFVPLVTETYYYAIPKTYWNKKEVIALRKLLTGSRWRECIQKINGYGVSEAGEVDEGISVLGAATAG